MLDNPVKSKKLAVPTKNGTLFINEKDILYCKANGSYTSIHLKDKESLLVAKSLGKVHQAFVPDTFARIHNSFIVNVSCIIGYSLNGQNKVTLIDGTQINVSRNRKKSFFNLYKCL